MHDALPETWDAAVRWFLGGTVVFALGFEGITMMLGAQFLLSGVAFIVALALLAFMVYWAAWRQRNSCTGRRRPAFLPWYDGSLQTNQVDGRTTNARDDWHCSNDSRDFVRWNWRRNPFCQH